jgi:hypothetical protein
MVAYRVGQDGGPDSLLWSAEEKEFIYPQEAFLHFCGRYLIRLVSWVRGDWPDSTHIGLVIYEDGKVVRRERVSDLIGDSVSVFRSPSWHWYRFVSGRTPASFSAFKRDELFSFHATDEKLRMIRFGTYREMGCP